jgi:serine/threonine protein kinase
VMQLAWGGDLFDFPTSTGGVSEDIARFFFVKVLSAVEHLHYLGIAHKDIKLENILIDQDFNPLLTDFGFSCKLSEIGFVTSNPSHKVGTERNMSPELLANGFHSAIKDDLFGLGYLLFLW